MARLPLYVDLSRDAPIWSRRGEPVAQPVEHLTFNQGVKGSNPFGLTTFPPSRNSVSVLCPQNSVWACRGAIADGRELSGVFRYPGGGFRPP